MVRADRWSGGVLLAFALAVIYGASRMPLGNLANPGPGFFPFWGAVLLALLSLALILRPTTPVGDENPAAPLGGTGRLLATLCVYALIFEFVGYVVATIGLLVVVLRENRQRPAVAFGIAIGVPLATYYGFAKVLGVALPAGLLPF